MFVAEEVASGNKLFSYDACKLLNLGCNCSLQTEELLIHLKGDKKKSAKKEEKESLRNLLHQHHVHNSSHGSVNYYTAQ
jgi:hypothetical protein